MVALSFAKYTLLCRGNNPPYSNETRPDLRYIALSVRNYDVGTKKYVKTMPANGENSAPNPPVLTLPGLFAVSIFTSPCLGRRSTALIE